MGKRIDQIAKIQNLHRQDSANLIVLLGRQESGKLDGLLSVLGWSSFSLGGQISKLPPEKLAKISLCSSQDLLHSHLTAWENLTLMAALYGVGDLSPFDKRLVKGGFTEEMLRTKLYNLPRYHRRVLQWTMALLPNPDVILADDLTAGLSLLSKRDFWRLIQVEQAMLHRTILYATDEIETARSQFGQDFVRQVHARVLGQGIV